MPCFETKLQVDYFCIAFYPFMLRGERCLIYKSTIVFSEFGNFYLILLIVIKVIHFRRIIFIWKNYPRICLNHGQEKQGLDGALYPICNLE